VPLSVVELLWGLDNMDTQHTATRVADFALLDFDPRREIVRLHDEIRLYLGRTLSNEAVLHAKLVDRPGNPREPGSLWVSLAPLASRQGGSRCRPTSSACRLLVDAGKA
jgi:hypothetical protein